MRRTSLTLVWLAVIISASVCLSMPASAELPEWSPLEKNAFSIAGEKATLERKAGIAPIACESSSGEGELVNVKEGTTSITFAGCTASLSGKCTGLSDATAGQITVHTTWKLGYVDTARTKLGIAFKGVEAHVECEKTISLVAFRGGFVGLLTPTGKLTKTMTIELIQSKGVNEFLQVLNSANTSFETFQLEAEINGGAFAQAGLGTTLTLTFLKLIEFL